MFILWYSASSTFGKDSDIVMGVRAQQKEKTRRSLVEAAFSQLSAERSFASLSLREVAREAGIAPTSFYRHFRDVDELGLTMVDESGFNATPTHAPGASAYRQRRECDPHLGLHIYGVHR